MSAIITYPGAMTAREQADLCWNMPTLPAAETARHNRIMAALRNLPPSATPPRPEPAPWADGQKWRYLDYENQNTLRRDRCRTCRGTGEIGSRGFHGQYEGSEPCPRCQRVNPYARTIDEIPF